MIQKTILKFETISRDLTTRIKNKEFEENRKLPPEAELIKQYNCSRPTLRKALEALKEQNLLSTLQGSGTYLIQQNTPDTADSLLFGLIFPNFGRNYIFDSLSKNLAAHIAQANCSLIYGGYIDQSLPGMMEHVRTICSNYLNQHVKGVFFSPFEPTPEGEEANRYILETFRTALIPVVLLDGDVAEFPDRSNYDIIGLDHFHASYTITTHLLQQRIKRILFITPFHAMHTVKVRYIGYRAAMLDHGVVPGADWYQELDTNDLNAVQNLFNRLHPEGILCLNDGFALNFITAMQKIGLTVPKDTLIGGFDNMQMVQDFVSLTTISQPIETISIAAIKMLFTRMQTPGMDPVSLSVPGKLIIRQSSQCTPAAHDEPVSLQ
jgi:DNA-binding LacI/PurR family transcriptional regulator